ncbi:MAG TPA: hypothetical protein VGB70_07175 [Allosphingosinicella sp.]
MTAHQPEAGGLRGLVEVLKSFRVEHGPCGDAPPAAGESDPAWQVYDLLLQAASAAPPDISILDFANLLAERFNAHPGQDTPGGTSEGRGGATECEAVVAALSGIVVTSLPEAAALKLALLHRIGRGHEAWAFARRYIDIFPENRDFVGAALAVALDLGDVSLAKRCIAMFPQG